MNILAMTTECLVESTVDYGSKADGENSAFIEQLGIRVRVKEVQVMQGHGMLVLVLELTASLTTDGPGMTVTCVGIGADAKAASGSAVAQWVLGVLPVVARWRGGHSCLAGPEEPVILREQFDLISGPVISRGSDSGNAIPAEYVASFSDQLVDALRSKRLAQRIHWLETFAVRHQDGTVDATCRLNNHDWKMGRRILIELATSWPVPQAAMTTCRQFTMLIPRDGSTHDLSAPSFWNRLLGSA